MHHKVVVFDHDHSHLETNAINSNAYAITTEKDTDAASELLSLMWDVALVHIDEEPWRGILLNGADGQTMIRFSTQGFPPKHPPIGTKILALHCLLKISDVSEEDIKNIISVCSEISEINRIREGIIPPSIQHLISFENPNHLRALQILLKGVLACYLSNSQIGMPGQRKKVIELLGFDSFPPPPNQNILNKNCFLTYLNLDVNKDKSEEEFRLQVAKELGVNKDALKDVSGIDSLIMSLFSTNVGNAIIGAKSTDSCIDLNTAIEASIDIAAYLQNS